MPQALTKLFRLITFRFLVISWVQFHLKFSVGGLKWNWCLLNYYRWGGQKKNQSPSQLRILNGTALNLTVFKSSGTLVYIYGILDSTPVVDPILFAQLFEYLICLNFSFTTWYIQYTLTGILHTSLILFHNDVTHHYWNICT